MSGLSFEEWYSEYPRKVAKQAAKKAWNRAVKQTTPEEIKKRLWFYMETEWRGREKTYLPYPATFLNGEDWSERTEAAEDELEKPADCHWCEVCKPGHAWEGRPDLPYKATCPAEVEAMRKALGRA